MTFAGSTTTVTRTKDCLSLFLSLQHILQIVVGGMEISQILLFVSLFLL